ncbi:hypothetical protein LTR05_006008 [Lithohypha guttulata]|uniref:FAD-binding PCMH-type domain-containing protein n=1 Tax=Lithohypha guttulata TaxID=1690604 RepID=A0AAN7Y4Z9_9EURO|nr:hypothetical protein LTR05_006008 [Lithohypha guttulata]
MDSFNNDSCNTLSTQWSNTSFVASNPWLADYNDESCSPASPDSPCTTAGYPAYIITAAEVADVQAGLDFARTHNIRLVVKGTGHDFPGRSSGAGSLSIYTHNLRGMEVNMSDQTAMRYGGIAAVKIAAGMRFREIYTEAAKHNITVVGGADPGVGIGGWILNGGHSPISSLYGLGADQILSLEVVTSDGQHRIVNETSFPDLFWALRGGRGSTFAVMLSVTVKAYPQLRGAINSYSFATTADSETFWSMLTYFHSEIPRISEAGGMGYHYLVRGVTIGIPEVDMLTGGWFFPQKTVEQMNVVLNPILATINASSLGPDTIHVSSNDSVFEAAMYLLARSSGETAGISGRLGSWLLTGPALTNNFEELKKGLRTATPQPWNLISHVVGGPGVRNAVAHLPGGSNAVLPAWRIAYTHVVLPRAWPTDPSNTTLKQSVTSALRDVTVPALKSLAPVSGAFINEADPTNPDWKHDYFGSNYERLLKIKHTYDPRDVFWCKPCVGWDEWEIVDGPDNLPMAEWGVGQSSGRLCRKV